MGIFNLFKKNKKANDILKKTEEKGNENIIELATIISNNDSQVIEDITLLVTDYQGFLGKYKKWCETMCMSYDYNNDTIKEALTFWLCGYETEYNYGAYIDWKAETEDILHFLKLAIEKLGYPLELDNIKFTGEEDTAQALQLINENFMRSGYTLFNLDLGSDSYNLFITSVKEYYRVDVIGKEIGYVIYNKYED